MKLDRLNPQSSNQLQYHNFLIFFTKTLPLHHTSAATMTTNAFDRVALQQRIATKKAEKARIAEENDSQMAQVGLCLS